MKTNKANPNTYYRHNGLYWLRNDLVFLSSQYSIYTSNLIINKLDISIFPWIDKLTNISKIHIVKYTEKLTYEDMYELHEFAYILHKIYNRRLIIHIAKNQVAQLKNIAEEYPDFKDMDVFTFAIDNGFKIKNMSKTYCFTTANKVYVELVRKI